MEQLYQILSGSCHLDKRNQRKRKKPSIETPKEPEPKEQPKDENENKNKKVHSAEKQAQIHQEEITAYRRRLKIHCSSSTIDPFTSFDEITCPAWWKNSKAPNFFESIKRTMVHNLNEGKWSNPTPIQMQSIPILLQRNDILACAPTGSGKSGAFIVPALFLASAPSSVFYQNDVEEKAGSAKAREIRTLFLAPTRELASQLHRETQRIGENKAHSKYVLLEKSNLDHVTSAECGKHGIDVLITTPLRLVDTLQSHPNLLSAVRLVVLDEADRLLDASYEHTDSKTFLRQMDQILSHIPPTASRALFSATIGSQVQTLSESILRSRIDVFVNTSSGNVRGGANDDIAQQLLYVGREQGKLLAIRQLIQKGIKPPVLIFLESKERAIALYKELLYDQMKVDVIHSDKSPSSRQNTIQKFRSGETWILITTDLCSRGVDFKHVNLVINYDIPSNGIVYTHRIGRTGRAGRKGESITFYTEDDAGEDLRKIVNVMKLSGCDVPDWLFHTSKQKQNDKKVVHKKESGKKYTKRAPIYTTPKFDREQKKKKKEGEKKKKGKKKKKKVSLEK